MNFYGLETESEKLVCSWVHEPGYYLDILQKKLGVDTIRLPFSYDYVIQGNFETMDMFIRKAAKRNITIILDYHRNRKTHQGANVEADGLTWDEFIHCWRILMCRYYNNANVQGIGIYNEIQGFDSSYWEAFYRYVLPRLREGYHGRYTYYCGCLDWGKNCGIVDLDVVLQYNDTIIEVHKYDFEQRNWDDTIPNDLDPSRIFIGELGFYNIEWAVDFLAYAEGRGIYNSCMWTIAFSGDTGGWWNDDCTTEVEVKWDLMYLYWGRTTGRTP